MNFIRAVISAFARYFDFCTRSSRSEYWYFMLFTSIVYVALASWWVEDRILDVFIGLREVRGIYVVFNLLPDVYGVLTFIPTLALAVRRLHDTSRSGWWLLLAFVPIVGWIALVVMLCRRGDDDHNAWGENPLRVPLSASSQKRTDISFIRAVISAFVRYFDFDTRSSRSDYWFFMLFVSIVYVVLAWWVPAVELITADCTLTGSLCHDFKDPLEIDTYTPEVFGVPAAKLGNDLKILNFFTIIPALAVAVRRLHDTSRSGWWLLLGLVPDVGLIPLIVMFCFRGDNDQNKWGDNPLRDSLSASSKKRTNVYFTRDVQSAFVRYFDFRTRSSRSEYWYFMLFIPIAYVVLARMSAQLWRFDATHGALEVEVFGVIIDVLPDVFGVLTFIPALAVAVRRLHDTSRSGWWLLLAFVPFVGWIALVVMFCIRGDDDRNKWSENPLQGPASASP